MELRDDKGLIEGLKKLPKDKLKKIRRMAEIAANEINSIEAELIGTQLSTHSLIPQNVDGTLWTFIYDLKMVITEALRAEKPKTAEMEISGQAGLE